MEKLLLIKNKNNENIYGVAHVPNRNHLNKKSAFIFLHGWLGCKAGPHRLFVKIARSLMGTGHFSLRFDFRGRGSSQVIDKVTIPTFLDDAETIINFVIHKRKVNKIHLIGISIGSIAALLAKHKNLCRKVSKLILLSPIPYTEILKKYAFEPFYKFNINQNDMLFIFGEKDPIKDEAIASYKHIFGSGITKRMREIKDIEHGFYSSVAEDMIIKNIMGFIKEVK